MNASRAAFRTNSQVPKIGRPSWEPGITRQEVTYGAATISAPLLRRQLSGGTAENNLSVNSRKLGSRGDFLPSPGSIPLRESSTPIPDLGPKAPTCQAELKQWPS